MPDLGSNIVADIVAALVIAVLGWLASVAVQLPFVGRKRRDLFRFFGITEDECRFLVYLSTVFVPLGCATDFRGTVRTFQGPTITAYELAVVQPIAQLFVSPFLRGLPAPIRNWLGKAAWVFREISLQFSPSPRNRDEVEPTNVLTVGSQYFNAAGDLYTETGDPFLKMEQVDGGMVIRVRKGPREGDQFEQRAGQSDDLAIVEKLFDEAHGTTIFIAAGLGVWGTRGGVHYLLDNWAQLLAEYGTDPFAVCLRFQNLAADPYAYKKPIELARFH